MARLDTKKKIFAGAFECFSMRTYHEVKIIDIASAAGVGKGTVYEYFESKEDLYQQLLDFFFQEYLALLALVVDGQGSFLEKLRQLYENHIHYYKEMKRRTQGMLLVEKMINLSSEQELENKRKKMLSLFGKLVEQGIKEKLLRDDIGREEMVMVLIIALPSLCQPNDASARTDQERVANFIELLMHGMQA